MVRMIIRYFIRRQNVCVDMLITSDNKYRLIAIVESGYYSSWYTLGPYSLLVAHGAESAEEI